MFAHELRKQKGWARARAAASLIVYPAAAPVVAWSKRRNTVVEHEGRADADQR
ncbi:hypothetical protein GCM10023328_28070 [Modestobacter marinus]|uniref:Uncharacterized protein n=1 Tax=Modestobacter marinus TaxID=477641 RepID=A0ABQ2G920_9ACTN|nr:hypothetical protein GCM10011589_41010 [Modestobacter marinus]